jgi:hypothetical protein
MRVSQFLYPESITRCQHLKVNGVQCGSPSLKNRQFCFFHEKSRQRRLTMNVHRPSCWRLANELPLLEDANSIQVALMQVMRLLLTRRIEYKAASLLLYALQTASSNLRNTTFEPSPQQVVIDRCGLADTSLGDKAWYKEEFEEEEEEEDSDDEAESSAEEESAEGEDESDSSAEAVDIEACADPACLETSFLYRKASYQALRKRRSYQGTPFRRAERAAMKKTASAAGAVPSKPATKAVSSRCSGI